MTYHFEKLLLVTCRQLLKTNISAMNSVKTKKLIGQNQNNKILYFRFLKKSVRLSNLQIVYCGAFLLTCWCCSVLARLKEADLLGFLGVSETGLFLCRGDVLPRFSKILGAEHLWSSILDPFGRKIRVIVQFSLMIIDPNNRLYRRNIFLHLQSVTKPFQINFTSDYIWDQPEV